MTVADKLVIIADNTAAVAETVNASKVSVSGSTLRVDNVLNTGHALNIIATAETNVFVYGKNLIETATVTAGADNNKVLFNGSIKGKW